MEKKQIPTYLQAVLNTVDSSKEEAEVDSCVLLVRAYMAGLQGEDFPIEMLYEDVDIKSIPVQFHILIPQMSILKSGCTNRIFDYVQKNVQFLLRALKDYANGL